MIAATRAWYFALSNRERWLVGMAAGLTVFVVFIFGIILPAWSAIEDAKITHDEAVQRRGRIEATVEAAMKQTPTRQTASNADIELVVTQASVEEGFDIVKSPALAPGQISFRIEQARAPALFAWLAKLEAQGIDVRNITLRGGPGGTVTVDTQLQQVNR